MAHLTNFSFEFFYKSFTEDASLPFLYHGAEKSKMTKNSNQGGGGPALSNEQRKKPMCPFDIVAMNMMNKCAKFHKDSPSGKKS